MMRNEWFIFGVCVSNDVAVYYHTLTFSTLISANY